MSESDQNNQKPKSTARKTSLFRSKQDSQPDQLELVERLKRGDEKAWQEFIEEYGTRLYDHLRPKLPNDEATQDVLHDTLTALVRAIPNFDNRVTLSTFVFAVAQRQLTDYWRRLPGTVDLNETDKFQELIAVLPEEIQRILLMRYHIGYSINEIAHLVGKSYRETEMILQKARGSLRSLFGVDEMPVENKAAAMEQYTILQSVLQMLYTQQQQCLERNMTTEAAIFQRAVQFLQHLAGKHTMGETTESSL